MITALIVSGLLAQPIVPKWSINANHTLFWEGKPYLPFGLRIQGSKAEIARAKADGFSDVIVDLPVNSAQWTAAISALEAANMRYIIALDSMAPSVQGVVVEPQNYRIPNITDDRVVDLKIPGANSVWVVVAAQRDGNVSSEHLVNLSDGNLREKVATGSSLESVMLLYPSFNRLGFTDYWERLDAHRDELFRTLQLAKPGPGCRGILNPMGATVKFLTPESNVVPTSDLFRLELESFLRKKYTSVTTAQRAWSLSAPDFDDFRTMSQMVPLWSKTRGIGELWDTKSNKTYLISMRQSQCWRDIQEVIGQAAANRISRFVKSIETETGLPVLQECPDWDSPATRPNHPFSGIAARGNSQDSQKFVDSISPAVASGLQSARQTWLLASQATVPADAAAANIDRAISDMTSLGLRGIFLDLDDSAARKALSTAKSKFEGDGGLANWTVRPLMYPVDIANPAAPMTLPGGYWWLPTRSDGERVDLGTGYGCYRYAGAGQSYYALWSNRGQSRVRLRVNDVKTATFSSTDGSDIQPKIVKNLVEITLGTSPVLVTGVDQAPVPDDALQEALGSLAACFAAWANRIPNADQEALELKDMSESATKSPGTAMAAIRRQLYRVCAATGDFLWFEAENCPDHTMSEAAEVTGASNGRVLRVATNISSIVSPLKATYSFSARVDQPHTIWLAAAISPEQRNAVSIRIGDNLFGLENAPVSFYGRGFAWYKVGETNLVRGESKLELFVDSRTGARMDFDAILVTPREFRPDGVRPPVQIPPIPTKK